MDLAKTSLPAVRSSWRWMLVACIALAGCRPEIGDECDVSTDCSNSGDRLCDTTQPGGYCTQFNCEPGTCPDEAICVAFDTEISEAAECANPQGPPRLQKTFCLRKCDGDGDCRSEYDCVNMNRDNPWGAVVVEEGAPKGKVCTVPFEGSDLPTGGSSDVCTGERPEFDIDAGPEPATPDAGASDAAPEASTDASPEAGGDAAAADSGGG